MRTRLPVPTMSIYPHTLLLLGHGYHGRQGPRAGRPAAWDARKYSPRPPGLSRTEKDLRHVIGSRGPRGAEVDATGGPRARQQPARRVRPRLWAGAETAGLSTTRTRRKEGIFRY